MDYPIENLDPERFQQLCQALLAKEYKPLQCFPVAQPDGGRDATSTSFLIDGRNDSFMVFQVKYLRKPQAEPDPHKWLLAIIKDEAPKVKELIPKGAVGYVLLTNISGTAHPESGSIDQMNALLSEQLGIPSSCWWRDDINRRLDDSWNLKWAYPELMTGPDFLRLIIESGITEHRERRSAAIRAFLRHQYDMDEEVRFKQVELQNKLLDLFIDVPISLRDQSEPLQAHKFFSIVATAKQGLGSTSEDQDFGLQANVFESAGRWYGMHEVSIGTASLMLHRQMQQIIPHAVIEGAPGQGKSTLAQYICQVHRMRLLNENEVVSLIPRHHATSPIRLPIKVDLRDFAVWLGKKDPFNIEHDDAIPQNWLKSLESFLSALISHQSGGTQFSTDDLLAVFRISAVLIVLDGLDEVADMNRRREVVSEIVRGMQRLEENTASLQSIVTSRPAAFANSPGMPQDKYPHLQLLSLNRGLIMDYAEKWLRARHMDGKQSGEFRKVLREKLNQPHLRDLARNPMQLAILLSLVLTRGASLPDKRTALYDFYIDLFFSREAEKSTVVRDHRELLIDIHRYLAWHLHSQAERDNARPSIRQDILQGLVADYLTREGHDPALAKELFTGMVERVVALVSRVEGTFEFEVQPLREYFAACHLYYTAPQSSPGKERSGSKPDRFDAIARNFFWLNVTRFYAGCYSKGELPSLVERLQELATTSGFHAISHPRTLAATLLGDWVFTQNPKSVQQVVDLILKKDSLRYVIAPLENRRLRPDTQNALVLPPKCGRDELIKRCFDMLPALRDRDVVQQILELLKANSESTSAIQSRWLDILKNSHSTQESLAWLEYGITLGNLQTLGLSELTDILESLRLSTDPNVLPILFRARRLDYLHSSEAIFDSFIDLTLDVHTYSIAQNNTESPLDALNTALDPSRYFNIFRDRQPVSLEVYLNSRTRNSRLTWSENLSSGTESFASHRKCVELAKVAQEESQKAMISWATDITPWNNLIEAARNLWGDRWTITTLATVAAGIRSTTEKCYDCPYLFDDSKPLARRFRFARLKSGAFKWWATVLDEALTRKQLMFALLPLLSWGTANTLLANASRIDEMLQALSEVEWGRLGVALRRVSFAARFDDERSETLQMSKLPQTMSLRFATIMSERLKASDSTVVYHKYMRGQRSKDLQILGVMLREALDLNNFHSESWSPDLDVIEDCYSHKASFEPFEFRRLQSNSGSQQMPLTIAEKILNNPDKYPVFLVASAESRYREAVASNVSPVAAVAEKEGWFTESRGEVMRHQQLV